MPSPLKEYNCLAHGPFESRAKSPRCPWGCATVHWSPRTPPSIRTNTVTKQMDALQYQIAAEQGLSDMRSRYQGESVADNRVQPVATGFASVPEYMAAVSQGRAPASGMWGPASTVGLRAPSEEDRNKPTQLAPTWDDPKVKRVPAMVDKAYMGNPTEERAKVADLVRSGNV